MKPNWYGSFEGCSVQMSAEDGSVETWEWRKKLNSEPTFSVRGATGVILKKLPRREAAHVAGLYLLDPDNCSVSLHEDLPECEWVLVKTERPPSEGQS